MSKKDEDILQAIKDKFKDRIIESRIPRDRRIFAAIDRAHNVEMVKFLKEKHGFVHCATVTGYDAGAHLEVIYHLFDNKDTLVNITARVPKNDPTIESINGVLESANLYEREIFDLIGVIARNHPNMKRLVLPDDYPHDLHPLLKDAKVEIYEKD